MGNKVTLHAQFIDRVSVHSLLTLDVLYLLIIDGKWFEPRSIKCLSCVIIRVRVVFRKTVVGD